MSAIASNDPPPAEAGDVTVRALGADEAGRWDAFVDTCREATFFHRAGWKRVLEEGLGHTAPFIYAERDGAIEGVLPLGHVKSRLFGNILASTPFCACGGAVGSEAACEALEAEAMRRAEAVNADYLELRHRQARHPDWPAKRERYVLFRQELEADPDANYRRIRRKQRAMIRKGINAGLCASVDADLDSFYAVFAESVRNLGTPVFPKSYFRKLVEVFGDACEVTIVRWRRRPVAAVMSFYFRDEVLPYHGGGTGEARAVAANDFMYWELMRRTALAGVRVFDFGRSKVGTGSYDFKRHWNFPAEALHHEYHLVRATEVPELNPMNPKYRRFIAAWRRLPLPVARVLGPPLARNLG